MFEVWCPSHESRVLLPASRIVALRNTPVGPVLHWRCWCGTTGTLVRGRSVPAEAVETVEPVEAVETPLGTVETVDAVETVGAVEPADTVGTSRTSAA